jgi:hypothetical protein
MLERRRSRRLTNVQAAIQLQQQFGHPRELTFVIQVAVKAPLGVVELRKARASLPGESSKMTADGWNRQASR